MTHRRLPSPVSGASAPPRDLEGRLRAWFDYPGSSAPEPSADGAAIYLISDRRGHPAAYRLPAAGGEPVMFAPGSQRVGRLQPSLHGSRVVVATDVGGNERWELSLVGDDGTTQRRITANPERIHRPGAWRDRRRYVFDSNERDLRFFDVYEVDLDTPDPPRRIREENALVTVAAARGDRLLLLRALTNLDSDLLLRTGGDEVVLNPHTGEEVVFAADLASDAVYAATNPDREFAALYRFGAPGSTPELVVEFGGDLEGVVADRAGRRLALVENDRGWSRLSVYDTAEGELRPVAMPEEGVVGSVAWLPSAEGFVFDLSASSVGAQIYRADLDAGASRRLTLADRPMPAPPVVPTLGAFRAEDGLAVPFWEFRPPGRPPRATIVQVHGGPESQARPRFGPLVQFLVHEGYRVVAPNVRGSLGYGRSYVHLDDTRLRMNSVRDLRDLVRSLREREPPDGGRPTAFGVLGASYGGFMVLAALSTYPDLFDAGVDVVGIANFITFLERTGPWRRKVREDEYGSLAHDRDLLRSISPLFRADEIRAPLLVVHGANDPRVPVYEAEQIVEALERRRVPVEFLRFDDEGHGLVRRENQVIAYARAAAFFDRHLSGPR